MSRTRNVHHRSSLMPDIERSAEVSSNDLDSVYRKLAKAGKVARRAPRTWLERNERIYAALGYVPGRGSSA